MTMKTHTIVKKNGVPIASVLALRRLTAEERSAMILVPLGDQTGPKESCERCDGPGGFDRCEPCQRLLCQRCAIVCRIHPVVPVAMGYCDECLRGVGV